jgi:hypothetical protein
MVAAVTSKILMLPEEAAPATTINLDPSGVNTALVTGCANESGLWTWAPDESTTTTFEFVTIKYLDPAGSEKARKAPGAPLRLSVPAEANGSVV